MCQLFKIMPDKTIEDRKGKEVAHLRGKRIKFVRRITGMSMRQFAQYCHTGLTTLNGWENARNGLTKNGARIIAESLQAQGISCSIDWLMEGKGELPKIVDQSRLLKLQYPTTLLPKVKQLREQNLGYLDENLQREIRLFKELHPDHLLYSIADHSMEPLYHAQDIVGGIQWLGKNMEAVNQMDCIIACKEDLLMVRRVKLGSMSDRFSLYAINPDATVEHPPLLNVEIFSLAPIIRVWRANKLISKEPKSSQP
jgi:DNA-binding transcriptional regulator YiaG